MAEYVYTNFIYELVKSTVFNSCNSRFVIRVIRVIKIKPVPGIRCYHPDLQG